MRRGRAGPKKPAVDPKYDAWIKEQAEKAKRDRMGIPPPVPPDGPPTVKPDDPAAGEPVAPLTDAERALAGPYRLREFVAMSGQVPGGDARVTGILALSALGRQASLLVETFRLLPPSGRKAGYVGVGRWRLDGDEIVLEPFTTKVGEKVVDPLGPWVLRWKVERFSGGRVLLKAGEFTWELTTLDVGETPEK